MATESCVFCSIVSGDIPSRQVRSDERFVAIHDIDPKSDVHVLVLPREHVNDLDTWVAQGGSSDELMRFVHDTARELGVEGRYRVIINVGEQAGQTVHHLHAHVLAGRHIPGFH